MKLVAAFGSAFGLGLAVWLLANYGLARILQLVGHAGWLGITAVILFHLVQVLFSAAAWRMIAGTTKPRPSLRMFVLLRCIREGVNNLLPVAQIGGEFVGARLLQRGGIKLAAAIAGAVCDLTMEMLTQVAFTLLGLGLLLLTVRDHGIAVDVGGGLVIAAAVACGFLVAQWLGLARLIEAGLVKLGKCLGRTEFGEIEGLHAALIALYRSPRRLLQAAGLHMVSWLLGGGEVCLVLHVLGHNVDLPTGLVIESLGQAVKAAGFAVPGALGVQESGYAVIGALFGLSPELGIALSLVKRLREVVLGLPSLAAWHWLENRSRSPWAYSSGAAP
jgi:putative membrane protein